MIVQKTVTQYDEESKKMNEMTAAIYMGNLSNSNKTETKLCYSKKKDGKKEEEDAHPVPVDRGRKPENQGKL